MSRELDAEIAEKVLHLLPAYEIGEDGAHWFINGEERDPKSFPAPEYSVDIGYAWEIMKAFPGEVKLVKTPKGFYCRIEKPGRQAAIRTIPEFAEAKARTAPEALCLAALEAVK